MEERLNALEIALKNEMNEHHFYLKNAERTANPVGKAMFVQIANKFTSEITIAKGRQKINGTSRMGIMMLAAGAGSKITIIASGDDAETAIAELEQLLTAEDIDNFAI